MIKAVMNPDHEIVVEALKALKANGYYCPCALYKDDTTKCMCKDFRDKIDSGYTGECNCGLYIAVEVKGNE